MRQSFPPGSPPLLVEIDLESGIQHNDPALKLMRGAQSVGLRVATNAVWQPRYSNAAKPARQAIAFPVLPIASDTTYTFPSSQPSHVLGYLPLPSTLRRNMVVTRTSSGGALAVWRVDAGIVTQQTILNAASPLNIPTSLCGLPIVQAYWRLANLNVAARDLNSDGDVTDPGETAVTTATRDGLMFFTHPSHNNIYYADTCGLVNTDAHTSIPASPDFTKWTIRSYTNTNTDTDHSRWMDPGSINPPLGATALIIHLDRLWMARPNAEVSSTTSSGRYTTIYYTDPLNWRMIRADNFITVDDEVRALATPSSGGIGVGGQAQLVIFGIDTISVLDGDPTQGNTFQRILANNIGVLSQKSVLQTPYGIVLVATDGQVYLIPPGAQRIIPIGDPVLDVIQYNRTRDTGTDQTPVQLYWHHPYVYMMLGKATGFYLFDLSKPDTPKWWGPHTGGYAPNVMGESIPNNVDSISANQTYFFTHRPDASAGVMTRAYLDTMPDALYVVGQQATLTTGLIHVPGHRVQLDLVHVYQTRSASAHALSVYAITSEGNVHVATLKPTPPPSTINGTAVDNIVYPKLLTYQFGAVPVISDCAQIGITGAAGVELYIQKAYATVKVQPGQW